MAISYYSYYKNNQSTDLDEAIAKASKIIELLEKELNTSRRFVLSGLDPLFEDSLSFYRTSLSSLKYEREALQWRAYIAYLRTWAYDHRDPVNAGLSPVGYDEWLLTPKEDDE